MSMRASVVITNYNYGRYLGEAIESALQQTRRADEIIVVDDGSTDDSLEVAGRYPVRVLTNNHRGAPAAMAAGVESSTGDCFMLLNADDRMQSNYLETTLRLLEGNPDLGFVYTSVTLFGTVHDFVPARRFSVARLLGANYIHGSSLIRRSAYDTTRGFGRIELAMYEDWYLILDLVEQGWLAERSNDTTLYYRQHGHSRNRTVGPQHEEAIRRIIFDHPGLYPPSPDLWYWLHRNVFRRHPQAYIAIALAACSIRGARAC